MLRSSLGTTAWLALGAAALLASGCHGAGTGTRPDGSGIVGGTIVAGSAAGGDGGAGGRAGQSGDGGMTASGMGGSAGVTGMGGGGGSGAGGTSAAGTGGSADASGGTSRDGGASNGGSRGDGGDPACRPECLLRLFGGCWPEGTCTYVTGRYCWSNGFKMTSGYFDGAAGNAFFQNGVLCSVEQFSGNGYTFYDRFGAVLGTDKVRSDKSSALTCTGEDTVIVPSTCPSMLSGCTYGNCQVP